MKPANSFGYGGFLRQFI